MLKHQPEGGAPAAAFGPLAVVLALAAWAALQYRAFLHSAPEDSLLVSHVTAAVLAIAVGGAQFLPELRRSRPRWHRMLGRIYAGASLFAAATALLVAAHKAYLGWAARGLVIAALLWFCTTAAGLWEIRRRRLEAHRRWMLRSYALALTALTIRLSVRGLAPFGIADLSTLSQVMTWASLASNLALAEWLARRIPPARRRAAVRGAVARS